MHSVLANNYGDFNEVKVPIDPFIEAISRDKKNIGIDNVSLILLDKAAKVKKISCKNNEIFHKLCFDFLSEIRFK